MSSLFPQREQDYLYTIPMCPALLTGQGMGPTGSSNILRMDDVSFLTEINREFNWCWYINFWNLLGHVVTRYSEDFVNVAEDIRRPLVHPHISYPSSRLAIVNSGDLYFDDNSGISGFSISREFYDSPPSSLTGFLDIPSDRAWRIADEFSSVDMHRRYLAKSDIMRLYQIHDKLKTIIFAINRARQFHATAHTESDSSKKWYESSGSGDQTTIEYKEETQPTTHTYDDIILPTANPNIGVYDFYGFKGIYSDEVEIGGETSYTDQCYNIYSSKTTVSNVNTVFVPITKASNGQSGSKVFTALSDVVDKLYVFGLFSHHRSDNGSSINPESTAYRMVDLSSAFSSYGTVEDECGIYLDFDFGGVKNYFSDVEDSVKSPVAPNPPYDVSRTVRSRINFYGYYILIKPKWRCTFTP